MGQSQEGIGSCPEGRACPKKAQTQRSGAKGDHRGHEAAMGSLSEGSLEVKSPLTELGNVRMKSG
jgi:hypothetical protein